MADRDEQGEFKDVSSVRPGFKREFNFAFKSNVENACSIGRTRVRRPCIKPLVDGRATSSSNKMPKNSKTKKAKDRAKECHSKKSPINVGAEVIPQLSEGSTSTNPNAKSSKSQKSIKLKRKRSIKKIPTNITVLLRTGLFEDMTVRCYGSKRSDPSGVGIWGKVRGTKILCYCEVCNGARDFGATAFESHAGCSKKHPADYIFMDNGKPFRYALNACKGVPLDSIEVTLRHLIDGTCRIAAPCNLNLPNQESQPSPSTLDDDNDRQYGCQHARMQVNITDGILFSWKLMINSDTIIRDLQLHELVFRSLPDKTKLTYVRNAEIQQKGIKKGVGIFCEHCKSKFSPLEFGAHAGFSSCSKPYLHLYMSNGMSLHELSIKMSRGQKPFAPRAFHRENNANAVEAGKITGIYPMDQITQRSIHIAEGSEYDVSGCALCRIQDSTKSGYGPQTVIICDQCEKEYNVSHLKEHNIIDLKKLPKEDFFCCKDCETIHSALQELVESREKCLPQFLLDLIKKKQEERHYVPNAVLNIRWRLLRGKNASNAETKKLLSKAVCIFHDRFSRIEDGNTHVDLIPQMVYGKSRKDQDFQGMYCAILLVNSSVACAGIIRIFGDDVAELPLVATRTNFQAKGYFQALFSCIEDLLGSLNVKSFVIPATHAAEPMWVNKFGFNKITEDELLKYQKDYPVMMFQGTSMLHKPVVRL